MSTYDIVCQTYDVVRLLERAVPAVSKEPDPLPTAKGLEEGVVARAMAAHTPGNQGWLWPAWASPRTDFA